MPVAAGLIAASVAAVAVVVTRWLVLPGLQGRHLLPAGALEARRRAFWLVSTALVLYTGAVAWAFGSGNTAVGIAIAVAVVVIPGLVVQFLSIRQG